jgi:hypothetical protein
MLKRYFKTKSVIVCLFLVCTGIVLCLDSEAGQAYQKSNLTFGMIKKNIIKGETTQDEITKLFGAPNIMTKNKSGEEVWTYDKISVSSSDVNAKLLVVGGSASSTSSKSMILVITFGEKDIVKDYAVMAQEF